MTEKVNAVTRPKNAFEFATLASARARQLQAGCVPKMAGSAKVARRAQQEVANGLVKQVPPAGEESK